MRFTVSTHGFSLIELVIVIAIIGIVSVAALVLLDPLEKVKKTNDVAYIDASKLLVTAVDSAYTVSGSLDSLCAVLNAGVSCGASVESTDTPTIADMRNFIQALIDNQEIKSSIKKSDIYKFSNKSTARFKFDDGRFLIIFPVESKEYEKRCGGAECVYPDMVPATAWGS